MTLSGLSGVLGPAFVMLFFILIVAFRILGRRWPQRNMRIIPAFSRLTRAISLAVEDGTRLHLSVGRGNITGPSSAAAFVGLSMLRQIALLASGSDRPPVATAGDGALTILTLDTLRGAYREMDVSEQFRPTSGRMAGLTPFSYVAGTLPMIRDEMVSVNLLVGNFGSEVALMTDAGERSGGFTVAGTDNIPAQAVLFATAQGPLIGEELYAGGAYLQAGVLHESSLRAQDVLRWVIVVITLFGGLFKVLEGFLQ